MKISNSGTSVQIPKISLTPNQTEIFNFFYSVNFTKVVLNKKERKEIWKFFKKNNLIPQLNLDQKSPAMLSELQKAISDDHLLQSAIFSECSYAQTLANMFKLPIFIDTSKNQNSLDPSIQSTLKQHKIKPRYLYQSKDGKQILIQAGGFGGVDCLYIDLLSNKTFAIEFKEPGSKTSEPDLPLYGEDGYLIKSTEFVQDNSQFEMMLNEQIENKLNFWKVMGSNVNNFKKESIEKAIEENYSKDKFADVICVEDSKGYLTMLPANQVGNWARIRGEIRPGGRNALEIWTPDFLHGFIKSAGGKIINNIVEIPESKLNTSKKRGGNDSTSRYKLNSIFFVYSKNVKISKGNAVFNINDIRQLKPTISAHMFFTKLKIQEVYNHYILDK